MVLCLLLGSILLVATIVSFPLYKTAAFNRMVQDEFKDALETEGVWPAEQEFTILSKKEQGGKTMLRMEDFLKNIYGELGVDEYNSILFYNVQKSNLTSTMNREGADDIGLKLGFMSDLSEHIELVAGRMYSESGYSEDGAIEVIVNQNCLVDSDLLVDEVLEYKAIKGEDGKKIRIKVVGVFNRDNANDFYWHYDNLELDNTVFMNQDLFMKTFTGENAGKYAINCRYIMQIDYRTLDSAAADDLYEKTLWYANESNFKGVFKDPAYIDTIEDYKAKQNRIEATLFILQIPVLILLGAFLFMISGQMYDMERNEISVMKSRGASGGQILRLYFYQSTVLAIIGAVFGLPLGALFCKLLGSARNFLEFNFKGILEVTYTPEAFMYAGAAILATILILTIPAIKHSRLSIVKLKQAKAAKKRSLWEKCFLDVILLGVSIYGYYNFNKNADALAVNVLKGESLDPLLYVSSSLFIVGAGLLLLRLQPVIVRLIYTIGKKRWKPAAYASFLENIKNGRKQQSIMLFMILTIALGMFHAIVARTILENAYKNENYLASTDIIVQEAWPNNAGATVDGVPLDLVYTEPQFNRFYDIEGVEKLTKVLYDEGAYIKGGNAVRNPIILMGINTKEFGEITYVSDKLLEKPYREYLNELAVAGKGLLVSRNFATELGYNIGDTLTVYDFNQSSYEGKIIDFFDYWPGYEPVTTYLGEADNVINRNNYLVVGHFTGFQRAMGVMPYEVWMKLKDGADSSGFYKWVEENKIKIQRYSDKADRMEAVVRDPLLQGTNGVLTMGFIVTMILCVTGYLIYWIMSIRGREMLFGVLRATGMHKRELFHMLINEQIFSGVFSVAAGIGIGKLASDMFVPMLQRAYVATNQVLPMDLITNSRDMVRLYSVVGGGMGLCLVILIILVFKLNIAKALKLGEE